MRRETAESGEPMAAKLTAEFAPPMLKLPPTALPAGLEPDTPRVRAAPQPQRRRSALASLVWLVVLSAAAGAAYHWMPHWLPWVKSLAPARAAGTDAKPPKRPVPVVTAETRRGDMDIYLNGLGTVTAFKTVTLRSRVDGQLMEVNFTEGKLVREGERLAEIDPRPFEVQLAQAEGQLVKDEANLKVNKLTLKRYEELLPGKAITPQQLDEQLALVQQAEGAIETDKAMIDNARLQLTYCHIIAPINGRIGLRLVDPGNMVRANDPNGLAIVTQLQPIALVFTIPQDEISRVQRKVNEGKPLTVEAHDRDFKTKLATGTLLAVDNQVDSMTGTVRLKAVFDNEDNMLFPNQFVNARLLIDVKRDVVIAPSAAVQHGPDFDFVYVVKSDETVELREVVAGSVEGDETAIESGLSAGEIVVTDGVDKLLPGAQVTLRERKASGQAAPRSGRAAAKESG